jgi:predicted O-linked N-acetylglucosamine transferase (SPINDLY family)
MKPARNGPCSCGSGKKYKHCCEGKVASRSAAPSPDQFNQLVALYNARRYAQLETRAQALIGRYPGSGFAWKLLGAALQMQGKHALAAFQKTAELMPSDAEAHFNLGVVQKSIGQLGDAVASYRRALKINPAFAEAHGNLGNALKDLGQINDAVASYRSALKFKPGFADAHNNLGTVLKDLGQFDEAAASYRRAVALKPDFPDAFYNLGNVLRDLGQLEDAVASYRRALDIKPDFVDALNNLGASLKELGLFVDAAASYRRIIDLKPGFADAYNYLGTVLKDLGQLDDAVANYRRALEIDPDYADAHSNLGTALKELGQLDDAVESYRRALEIKHDFTGAYSNLLFTLNYSSRFSPTYCLDEARRYGRLVSDKVDARFTAWQCTATPERLRVGLVSGDLRNHPVGYFLESLLTHIDPVRIELIAYPTDTKTDALTARIKPFFSAWKPLSGLSDEAAARLIHADGVHILMDLAGHSRYGRLPMFAWKPSPVQAAWLGYFATTGVSEIDYLLADQVGVPEDHREQFTETVWYLPDTRLCFSPPETDLPVAPLPAQNNGHITFGCFQNMAKVEDGVLSAWAAILAALPGSRLRWQCHQFKDPAVVKQLMPRLQQHGFDPAQVELLGSIAREAYLAAHSKVDMILDTFPYPGGTTTCEALWMGVPTLTLAGDTLLSRQGASLLTAAGLRDWIAASRKEYAAKALEFASDLPRLAALRAGLREQARASPLFDAARFALNLEDALWGMWQACRDSGRIP